MNPEMIHEKPAITSNEEAVVVSSSANKKPAGYLGGYGGLQKSVPRRLGVLCCDDSITAGRRCHSGS